jgi:hypothetical protein
MENAETVVGWFLARGRMALAQSNRHYGSAGPSQGRGRARAGQGHRTFGAHHSTAGGCTTPRMAARARGVRLARWEAAELTWVVARRWGGETGRRDGVSQWRRCSCGPLGIQGGPAALWEEEHGEGCLKSQGVWLRLRSPREGGAAVPNLACPVVDSGRGAVKWNQRGDEGGGGGSVPLATCANKGVKWRSLRRLSCTKTEGEMGE